MAETPQLATLSSKEDPLPAASMENLNLKTPAAGVEDLRKNTGLWYKIHVLIYDLRNFRESKQSHDRLDQIADASYIGMPYFSSDEAKIIKSTVVKPSKLKHPWKSTTKGSPEGESNTTNRETLETLIENELNERLERRMKKREESGDFRVCAAHDMAPIFEKAFGIDPKQLSKDQAFLDLMARSGLKLKAGDDWNGLPKKTFAKKGKKH